MHCKRTHGVRLEARVFVLGSVCLWCKDDCITRPRVIAHLARGALSCSLAWRTGCLPPLSPEEVLDADMRDKQQRKRSKKQQQAVIQVLAFLFIRFP